MERKLEQGLEESMAGSDPVSITQPSKSKIDKQHEDKRALALSDLRWISRKSRPLGRLLRVAAGCPLTGNDLIRLRAWRPGAATIAHIS